MKLSSPQNSSLNNHPQHQFLVAKGAENRLPMLFYNSLIKGASITSFYEWTEKVQNEINELESLMYNSHNLCSTLYQSVISKILDYDKMILALEKNIRMNELILP